MSNYETITSLSEKMPLTEWQIRWFIRNQNNNGLANYKAVFKQGKRWYIDVPKFEEWFSSSSI